MSQKYNLEKHLINEEIPLKELNYQELIDIYKSMLTISTMEKFLEKEYNNKHIRGFCHLVIGQECLYALLKKLMDRDLLISSYRCHGAAYSAGIGVKEIVCENLGTRQGNNKGKGGSMHLYNERYFGGHGIVGAQVPIGAGLAFALKYKKHQKQKQINAEDYGRKDFINCKSDEVAFVIYGDGASNQGQVYETFNMAKVYNLPVVFIVENNKYGMYTPIESVSVDDCFYKRGYSIPGIRVKDIEIESLYSALLFAKEYSMVNGPIIIQVDTNRICGHSTLDQKQPYRNNTCQPELDSLRNLETRLKESDVKRVKAEVKIGFDKIISEIDYSDTLHADELYTDLFYP